MTGHQLYIRHIIGKAETIFERIKNRHKYDFSEEFSKEETAHYLELWKEACARGDSNIFAQRLSRLSLTPSTVLEYIKPAVYKDNIELPQWAQTFSDILMFYKTYNRPKHTLPIFKNQKVIFEELYLPFVLYARKKLLKKFRLNKLNFARSPVNLLTKKAYLTLELHLMMELKSIVWEPLEEEFKEFQKTNPTSATNSEELQHRNFIMFFFARGPEHFFQKYPVAAKIASLRTQFWINNTFNFIKRFKNDQSELKNNFFQGKKPGKLAGVSTALSDSHHKGKKVIILTFTSDNKIIYKPRNISIYQPYNDFIRWTNKQPSTKYELKALKILDKQKYGWVEFISYKHPAQNQLRGFYNRLGMITCLIHLFNIKDLHYENFVTHGNTPVLIDQETLLSQDILPIRYANLSRVTIIKEKNELPFSFSFPQRELLPKWERNNNFLTNISYIGFHHNLKNNPFNNKLLKLNYSLAKDVQKGVFVPTPYKQKDLLPFLKGFEYIYNLVLKNKKNLLKKNGLLNSFKNKQNRFIFRNTDGYTRLLEQTLTPNALKDSILYSIILDRLSYVLSTKNKFNALDPIFWHEIDSLTSMDIPFYSEHSNTSIFSPDKKHRIYHYFNDSSYNQMVKKFTSLSTDNLKNQIRYNKASLIAETIPHRNKTSPKIADQSSTSFCNSINKAMIEKEVHTIADSISDSLVYGYDNNPVWFSNIYDYMLEKAIYTKMEPLLYDGYLGAILFLMNYDSYFKSNRFQDIIDKSVHSLERLLPDTNSFDSFLQNKNIGFNGLGGLLYTIGKITISQYGSISFISHARNLASSITSSLIEKDREFDIISGSAGLVAALISLYEQTHDDLFLKKAKLVASHIIDNRIFLKNKYVCWKSNGFENYIGGFAHGTAGILYSLSRLNSYIDDSRYDSVIKDSLNFLNHLYNPSYKNWKDQRFNEEYYGTSWCHGSAGIGLLYLQLINTNTAKDFQRYLKSSLHTVSNSQSVRDTLCCGSFGQIDFLISAHNHLPTLELSRIIDQKLTNIINRKNARGYFLLDTSSSVFTMRQLTFMKGLSGIGYTLLRYLSPQTISNVTLLQ